MHVVPMSVHLFVHEPILRFECRWLRLQQPVPALVPWPVSALALFATVERWLRDVTRDAEAAALELDTVGLEGATAGAATLIRGGCELGMGAVAAHAIKSARYGDWRRYAGMQAPGAPRQYHFRRR